MTRTAPGPDDYCRAVETYLCQKNDGHLVRIVGPAFEQVRGWWARGVPLGLAYRGIDRYFERYYAKGPRRRPVRIEFCEADVLDVFDQWRRAVGVPAGTVPGGSGGEQAGGGEAAIGKDGGRRSGTLPVHLDRVIARLTRLRGSHDRSLDAALDQAVRDLDTLRSRARSARGAARQAIVDRLGEIDTALVELLRSHCDASTLAGFEAEAAVELAPFRGRLSPDAFVQAVRACVGRKLRDRVGLPVVAFD